MAKICQRFKIGSGSKQIIEALTSKDIPKITSLLNTLYIVEVKFNESTEKALEQIEDKEYFQPFIHSGKKIRLLGINFYRYGRI